MFKFIHAADIHLDSPLKGLEQYEGAPADEIRGATRRALENLVDLALRESVDFALLAGDLYDGDWKDHNTGLFFVAQMARLREANIPVVAISGNHDAANKMTKSLRLPDNVELLPPARPSTARSPALAALGVAVHGQSFAQAAETENLALAYPDPHTGHFNIGLLHTALAGADGHEPYAPCSLADLKAKGYDYWALGHVHERRIVCEETLVVFPGNVQGRHIREPGAKGCYLVQVDDRSRADLKFQPLDVFRWEQCRVVVEGVVRAEDILEAFATELTSLRGKHNGMPLAVRVLIEGRCLAHDQVAADQVHWINQLRAVAVDRGDGNVWIEKVKFQTAPELRIDEAAMASGPLSELRHYFQELRRNDAQLMTLATDLDDLRKKLPDELQRGADALLLNDADWLRAVLGEVEPLLISRLRAEVRT